jgi:hypothetical protein
MDPIAAATLDRLHAVLAGLLPAPAGPLLQTDLSVIPLRFRAPGLGNYIGLNQEPLGSLYGRRLHARVLVTVAAAGPDQLDDAVTMVTHALLAADRTTLRPLGLLSLTLDDLGPRVVSAPDAADTTARREVALTAFFEYVQLPESAEGIITQISVKLAVSSAPASAAAPPPAAGQGGVVIEEIVEP